MAMLVTIKNELKLTNNMKIRQYTKMIELKHTESRMEQKAIV